MKLSIIIPVYNQEKTIVKCLKSLERQTFKNFEVIVIDDGSKDNLKFKIKNAKLQFKMQNLKLIEQKHAGPAKARNFGAKKAQGDILVFVDGDMFFDKNFLKELIHPINLGKAKGVYSTKEEVANWDNVWARCWNYNWGLPDRQRVDPRRTDQQKDFRAVLKKEFERVGGFDDTGYTDTWTLRQKLGYAPRATQAKYYHYNPASLKQVFFQAKWAAKRKYKLGILGKIIALLRANFLFSLINGFKKAVLKKEPLFLVFKLVYDLAVIVGLMESKTYK